MLRAIDRVPCEGNWPLGSTCVDMAADDERVLCRICRVRSGKRLDRLSLTDLLDVAVMVYEAGEGTSYGKISAAMFADLDNLTEENRVRVSSEGAGEIATVLLACHIIGVDVLVVVRNFFVNEIMYSTEA